MASACLGFSSATATRVSRRWSAMCPGPQKKRFSWSSCLPWAAFAWCSIWLSSIISAGARSRPPSGASRPAGSLSVKSGRRTWRICLSHPTWDAHSPANRPTSDDEDRQQRGSGMNVQQREWTNSDFNLMKMVWRSNKMTSPLWQNETECKKKTKPQALRRWKSAEAWEGRKLERIKEDNKFRFANIHNKDMLIS